MGQVRDDDDVAQCHISQTSESSMTPVWIFNKSMYHLYHYLPVLFSLKLTHFLKTWTNTFKGHFVSLNKENKGKISVAYHKVEDNLITSKSLNEKKMFLISNRYGCLPNIVKVEMNKG